jgi:hypothetical protein
MVPAGSPRSTATPRRAQLHGDLFTRTAAGLCAELGREHLDADIAANAYTLMGGGLE